MALSNLALQEFSGEHISIFTNYEPVPIAKGLPFPTVKICPLQFYDKFNLQRVLLDEIEVKEENSTRWKDSVLQDFQVFLPLFNVN